MPTNTTTVQALKELPHRRGSKFVPVFFESDNVGAIDTRLRLPDIQKAIEEVCVYLGHSVFLDDNLLSAKHLKVNFYTADHEQLYYALNMLVERRIINYNPATLDGVLFGKESCQEWTDFGTRIYPGRDKQSWSLSSHVEGVLSWQPYIF